MQYFLSITCVKYLPIELGGFFDLSSRNQRSILCWLFHRLRPSYGWGFTKKKTPQWRFEWRIFIHVLPPLFTLTLVNNFQFPYIQYQKWYQRKVVHSFDHHMHFLFDSHTLRNLQDKCQGFRIVCGREICRTLTIKLCLITSHFNISCVTQAQLFLYRCAFRNWLIFVSIQFHFLFLNCHNFYATHLKTYS